MYALSHPRYSSGYDSPPVRYWRQQGLGFESSSTGSASSIVGAVGTGAANATGAAIVGGTDQLVMSAPSIAGGVASAIVGGTAAASTAAIAIPIIGVAVVGVTLLLTMWYKNRAQKVAATKVVNEIEPFMQQNLAAYKAGPHTRTSQAQALANFDAGWKAVVDKCGVIGGGGGDRCVTDRQSGSCVWHDATGTCWNWFSGYRDPIANDPDVRPDPVVDAAGNIIPMVKDANTGQWVADPTQSFNVLGTTLSGTSLLMLAGAGLLLFMALGSKSGGGPHFGGGR